jgi:integrase
MGIKKTEGVAAPFVPRLFCGGDLDEQAAPLSVGRRGLTSALTLSEFYRAWFVPIVLSGERQAAAGTLTSYAESIAYWSEITGDPPLAQVDEFTLAQFQAGIAAATYRRGLSGPARPLSEFTRTKHLKQVRAVLFRTGPRTDPRRPSKALLAETPHLVVTTPHRSRPRPPFTLAIARATFAACRLMGADPDGRRSPGDGGPAAVAWWRALIAVLYFTGLRCGTIFALEWTMIERRGSAAWLNVPGGIVKTKKPVEKFLRAEAAALVEHLPRTSARVFAWSHSASHLVRRHHELQRLGGVSPSLSLHAWRRTHATELYRLGAGQGLWCAQMGLDHADAATTSSFYVDLEAELIAKLPALADPNDDAAGQGLLF